MAPSPLIQEQLFARLTSGLNSLGLVLDQAQQQALIDYLLLLDKWNNAYNLSGIKDVLRMLGTHLLDSLAIVPFIEGRTIMDAGTGAGLPGIPLAICHPGKRFLLLDSNGKKTRFLTQVKMEIGLDNVTVCHDRLENFQSREQVDIVLCRAYAALDLFATQSRHLLNADSRLLAMKGQFPDEEVKNLPAGFDVLSSRELAVPGVEGSRHLIEIGLVPAN